MAQFENSMDISEITFTKSVISFCPLGNDHYTNKFTVTFIPGVNIPDYIDVESAIEEQIGGAEVTLEDAVARLYDIIMEYDPVDLEVRSYGDDAVHFPVEVVKRKQ